jgi:hypothetical protein
MQIYIFLIILQLINVYIYFYLAKILSKDIYKFKINKFFFLSIIIKINLFII